MKAAVFYKPKEPLKIEEVPTPEAKAGEVVIKIAACGVCHTDAGYLFHGVPTFKKPPLILGHEPSGVIDQVGDGVTRFKAGNAVLIPAVLTCGQCYYCRTGRENICQKMTMLGNHIDGAFAEYIAVPEKDVIPVPSGVPLQEGCIISDAISTPFHAVKNRAQVKAGDYVVVIGCGGVGMNVVQVATAFGGLVIAVDVVDWKLEIAKKLGAVETINSKETDPIKTVRKITGGGADIAMEVIGHPKTQQIAYNIVKWGGRVVMVGFAPKPTELNLGRMMFREIEMIGSLGCRPVDYPPLLRLVQAGKIQVDPIVTHRFSLAEINEAFDTLHKGETLRSIILPEP
jgi:6-hydroxycyclohex-1-ene-1-carbonyl-CoA dehydrogenase